METNKKSLCAKIPLELHAMVRKGQDESGLTLNEYVKEILTEFYSNQKGGNDMSEKTRTLAFQVTEDLFGKLKEYLKKNNITQKEFVIKLIEQALTEADPEEETTTEEAEADPEEETTTEEAEAELEAETTTGMNLTE